jgi:signal transduction histidine kinase
MVLGLYFFIVYLTEWIGGAHIQEIHLLGIIGAAIIFLPIRNILQRRIDHLFHREQYDSTNKIADFEQATEGVFDEEKLHGIIFDFLNSIFHFNSFTCVKCVDEDLYQSSHHMGHSEGIATININPSKRLKDLLSMGRPFDYGKLDYNIPELKQPDAELVLPRVSLNRIQGFFVCGRKKSGKEYTLEDIRLLGVITNRAAALFHTAELYNRELERQLAVEHERVRISKDLHDDIGSSLTRITMFSELAGLELNKLKTADDSSIEHAKKLSSLLEDISHNSRDIIEAMSDVIWSIDPRNDTLDNLTLRMKNYITRLLAAKNISYDISIAPELLELQLPIAFKRHIYLIFKESLNNIIRHSQATKVTLSIQQKEKVLLISISDNGRGFDAGQTFSGSGIKNIRQRTHSLNGDINIVSKPLSGTSIVLKLKIP